MNSHITRRTREPQDGIITLGEGNPGLSGLKGSVGQVEGCVFRGRNLYVNKITGTEDPDHRFAVDFTGAK